MDTRKCAQQDASLYKAQGRCLNVPGAVLNLWGAVNKQTDSRAWKEGKGIAVGNQATCGI